MKIKYGDNIRLRAYRIKDLVSDIIVGTFSSIIIEKSVSYTVQEKVTTSKQVKVGIIEMINASVKLEDLIDVGTSTQTTREYNFTIERTYAESLTQDYAINFDVDLDKIPSDKVSFSISRVAIFLELEVDYSYTEEQKWDLFKGYYWVKLGDTERKNYVSRFYIGDVISFCYNDDTFGNTEIGLYKLETIKEY